MDHCVRLIMKRPGPMASPRPNPIKGAVPPIQAKRTPAFPTGTTVLSRSPISPFILGWEAHLTDPIQRSHLSVGSRQALLGQTESPPPASSGDEQATDH